MGVWTDPDVVPAVKATIVPSAPVLAGGSVPSAPIRLLVAGASAITTAVIDRGTYRGPAAVLIANIGTGSPAGTVDLQGSVDGVNFYNCGYSLVATPNTVVVTQLSIGATATTTYLLANDQAWRYFRCVVAGITTNTFWITYYQ